MRDEIFITIIKCSSSVSCTKRERNIFRLGLERHTTPIGPNGGAHFPAETDRRRTQPETRKTFAIRMNENRLSRLKFTSTYSIGTVSAI